MKKLFLIFGLCLGMSILPLQAEEVILGGDSIGIEVEYDGVMVSGFYELAKLKQDQLEVGDLIISINGRKVSNIQDLLAELTKEQDKYSIQIMREGEYIDTYLNTSIVDGQIKTGMFLKEKLLGIGTLTYIDDERYGALGHEITDTETNQMINAQCGTIYHSMVTSIRKARPYSSGEKNAAILFDQPLGTITHTNHLGVYGRFMHEHPTQRIETASYKDIQTTEADFYTVLSGNNIESVRIRILKVNPEQKQKQIEFKVIDEHCLAVSNGIVQGMSGSPIVQNGRLIGAVTHVSSQDPSVGYGILIDEMLKLNAMS